MLLKAVRNILGYLIVGIDKLTRPAAVERSPEEQIQAQAAVTNHSLYQLQACPFCVKTRRAIHQLNIDIPLKDIGKDVKHRDELASGGGRTMVPCLRIDEGSNTRWMYESDDIIAYLKSRVATANTDAT